ncbi:MAG: hypothetical protein SFU86_07540 [Pirellulaceae bacterium]|nr:hypothetical protein [Pirellulaceae bacterium]
MPECHHWADAPIVEVRLATCPYCGSAKYVPVKGWRDADGGRTSWRVCACCSEKYIVLTIPSSGMDTDDVS